MNATSVVVMAQNGDGLRNEPGRVLFSAAIAFAGTFSGEECLVRAQRKNQRENAANKEHGSDGHGKILPGLRRPAARLPIGRQEKNRKRPSGLSTNCNTASESMNATIVVPSVSSRTTTLHGKLDFFM
jgi:hypothetical protein